MTRVPITNSNGDILGYRAVPITEDELKNALTKLMNKSYIIRDNKNNIRKVVNVDDINEILRKFLE